MLQAVNKNKVGYNFNILGESWKEYFKTSEDSLTSSVFERLFYLPVELFWNIFRKSCCDEILPEFSGPINYFEFWPHWESSEQSENVNFVEPDLFIRFNNFDIIIESKRWDQNQQNKKQWENEILAYNKEYKEESKKVFLIALGGISDKKTEKFGDTPIVKCKWKDILQSVKEIYSRLDREQGVLYVNDSVRRILNDIIIAFRLHGFSVGAWFDSFFVENLRIYNYQKQLNILKPISDAK